MVVSSSASAARASETAAQLARLAGAALQRLDEATGGPAIGMAAEPSKHEADTQIADELRAVIRVARAILQRMEDAASKRGAVAISTKTFAPLEPTESAEDGWVEDGHGDADSRAAVADGDGAHQRKGSDHNQPSVWSGFYNKTLRERYDVLALMYPRLERLQLQPAKTMDAASPVAQLGALPVRTANLMIENCIGVLGMPLGLGLNFVVDGVHLSVPMAVEEPSVVAAASSTAKLVATCGGGFRTATTGNIMTSQVQLVDTPDIPRAILTIAEHREQLLTFANTTLCANMKKRGGGAVDIYCRVVTQRARSQATRAESWYQPCADELAVNASSEDVQYLVVHIDVDVCEAMGANIVNTVAEGLSSEICRLTESRCGLRILTNLCMQRRARSTFEIPVAKLGWKGADGEQVASRIIEAFNFAAIDPYRAVTNNKGIMNGIDAVAIATGQDWRAIEAAAHCFASRSGQYASLSRYEIIQKESGERYLRGSLELPIAVGSKGGALQTHPGYRATHSILNHPSARALSAITVSVGLAQNFAAIRALAITGIQQGHMALHARNIAVAAGAPGELVSEVCTYMQGRKSIKVETAQEYLQAHEVYAEIRHNSPPLSPLPMPRPSMFYVEIPVPTLDEPICLNIAFESLNKLPQYVAIKPQPPSPAGDPRELPALQRQLLGDKGYNQLEKMFALLATLRSVVLTDGRADSAISRSNLALQNRLQLLSVLANIVAYRMMEVRTEQVGSFLRQVLANGDDLSALDARRCQNLLAQVPASDDVLSTGLPLFLALCGVLAYHIEQDVASALAREQIAQEQWRVLRALVQSFELEKQATPLGNGCDDECREQLAAYMAVHATRWQATMLLLVDALTLAPEVLTPTRVEVLHHVGAYMEWEGTIAHDIARYARAAAEGAPNAFVYWLQLRGLPVADGDQHILAFRRAADACAAKLWTQLEQDCAALPEGVLSLTAVQRVTQAIRDTYAVRMGRVPRRESF